MKIVDEKMPKSKAELFKAVANEIINNESKAVFFDTFSDVHYFGKIAKAMGYKTKWRKQKKGGWLVWAWN